MPNASRNKGSRFERDIVEELKAAGLDAYRVPLSGAMRGYKGDVHIRTATGQINLEAKVRASGFGFIYQHIEGVDALVIKADRQEPLLIMRLSEAAKLIGAKQQARSDRQLLSTSEVHTEVPVHDYTQKHRAVAKASEDELRMIGLQSIVIGAGGE